MSDSDVVIRLDQFDGPLQVQIPEQGGHALYYCTPRQLGEILGQVENTVVGAPWIDLLGATTPGVALQTTGNRKVRIVMSFPERRQQMMVGEDDQRLITIPPVVWLTEWHMDTTHLERAFLWVSEARIVTISAITRVMAWPFGNVYDHGAVCWGQVPVRHLTYTDPTAVDVLFFTTPFNDDLLNAQVVEGLSEEDEDEDGRTPHMQLFDMPRWRVNFREGYGGQFATILANTARER